MIFAFLLFPEGEVFLKELDYALGIAEVVFLELIDLVKGSLKGVVGKLAGPGVVLKHLVVEYGEVQGETKLDGVAGSKLNGASFFISHLSTLLDFFEHGILGVLGNVAIVITDHLDEECFGVKGALSLEDAILYHFDDLAAVSLQLGLNLRLVSQKSPVELAVLGVLLNGGDGAACGTFARNQILEGDRKKISLIGVDGATLNDEHLIEEVDHVLKALGLLSNSSKEDFLFDVDHLEV